ncbi:MAG: hypothetical protein HY403_12110, partial [Elusimicrobia bacterium]|nr:hypothetical protein [Elusimicrobiota bacterium]
MKPLFLLAVMLALPPAVSAADASAAIQADWRRDGVDERVKAALAGRGWRFEDDGRALDPRTKSPAPKAVLDRAVLDLRLGARRAALEAVNLMLASGKPLEFADAQRVKTLAADLPPALTAALLDPKSDARTVKALADADLSRVAAYFDGGRTMADRQAAAQPVSAGTPRPRTDSPYHTDQEKSVSEKMRASAEAAIGRHPFGKTVLSRLNGENGKPELPPIIIEDLGGSAVARYDFRRRAVALDSEIVLASVIGASPPAQASALRASLSARAALAA